jgi:isoleucyl-tRNA synthetase
LNKVLKDMINRFHLLQGRRVHYVPGWDCHGLPIENKTLKDLKKHVSQLSSAEIRAACQATASKEVESQKAQFKPLGVMADWDSRERTYRTLDHQYEMRQLRIFQKMVEKGLIYRHYRPVHYSPSSLSALAEAELVYKDDHVSHSVFVTFDLESSPSKTVQDLLSGGRVKLLVWTTTPWTLTANMGIAVHPELVYSLVRSEGTAYVLAQDRLEHISDVLGEDDVLAQVNGSELVGTTYYSIFGDLPGASQVLNTVLPAGHVTADSGTGLVHCAPAHGTEDYQAFRSLGLISNADQMICHVGSAGEFLESVAEVVGQDAGKVLIGKSVLKDGSKAAVDLLRDVGQLVKVKRIKHRYPYDWKTDEPIILTATSQWFANLDNIKDNAVEALQEVSFIPPVCKSLPQLRAGLP